MNETNSGAGLSSAERIKDIEHTLSSDRISALSSEIATYTVQTEEYDRSSNSLIMTCIGIAGVLLSVSGAVSGLVGTGTQASSMFYEISAVAVALVPCIATLFLYILSMNCRRVAQFRGYVKFLEKRLNDEVGGSNHIYNTVVDPNMMGKFMVNQTGPAFLIIFWFVLIVVSVFLGFQLAGLSGGAIFVPAYHLVFIIVLLASVICSGICIYWLTQNGKAMEETYRLCAEYDEGVEHEGGAMNMARTIEEIYKDYDDVLAEKKALRDEEEQLEEEIPKLLKKGLGIRKERKRWSEIDEEYKDAAKRLNDIVDELLSVVVVREDD